MGRGLQQVAPATRCDFGSAQNTESLFPAVRLTATGASKNAMDTHGGGSYSYQTDPGSSSQVSHATGQASLAATSSTFEYPQRVAFLPATQSQSRPAYVLPASSVWRQDSSSKHDDGRSSTRTRIVAATSHSTPAHETLASRTTFRRNEHAPSAPSAQILTLSSESAGSTKR